MSCVMDDADDADDADESPLSVRDGADGRIRRSQVPVNGALR